MGAPSGEHRYRSGFSTYLMAAMSLLFIGFAAWLLMTGDSDGGRWFLLLWSAVVAFIAFRTWTRLVREIRVDGRAGRIEVVALARRKTFDASDLQSVRARSGNVELTFHGGKFTVLLPMTGLHELVAELKALQPGLDVRGI